MVSGGVMGIGVVVGAVKLRYIAGTDYLTFCHFVGTTLFSRFFPILMPLPFLTGGFFRVVFSTLLILGWYERHDIVTLIALLAMLPR